MEEAKYQLAPQLHEQGLTSAQIAERLGSNPRSVSAMISAAKRRRKQKAGEVEV